MSFMYAFGSCRRLTFRLFESRSRSRARMRSRSLATLFIRRASVSVCRSGIASVRMVATVAIATRRPRRTRRSSSEYKRSIISAPSAKRLEVEAHHLLHDENADRHPECADAHDDLARRRRPKKLDIFRAREIDQSADDEGQGADDHRGGPGFGRQRLDLSLHLFAFAQNSRKIGQCLGKAAARFLLNGDDDREEARLGNRHAANEAIDGLADREAHRLHLDYLAELATDRLGSLGGGGAKTIAERQAGFHAAHDDVNGFGKEIREFLQAPFGQEFEQPERQAGASDQYRSQRDVGISVEEIDDPAEKDSGAGGDDQEPGEWPIEARLRQHLIERGALAGIARLDLLETLDDLLAARGRVGLFVRCPLCRAAGERRLALYGFALAAQKRIDGDEGDASSRKGRQ